MNSAASFSRSSFAPLLAACAFALAGCSPSPEPQPSAASQIAAQITADCRQIDAQVMQLASFTGDLYQNRQEILQKIDRTKYGFAPNGSFYKTTNDGQAALWISGAVPITEEVQEAAFFTEPLDAELQRICNEIPAVVQAYYNDANSLNRIYPWMDVLTQYEPKMDIPTFNFYYLADALHNPSRGPVWVDEPYVDPAGRGWMISAIAPVYGPSSLLGVAGLDVTLQAISQNYVEKSPVPVAVIAKSGVLVAATEDAISILEMPRPKDHRYLETVKQDTFQPDQYNVAKSTVRAVRDLALSLASSMTETSSQLNIGQKTYAVHSAPVPELEFTVVSFHEK